MQLEFCHHMWLSLVFILKPAICSRPDEGRPIFRSQNAMISFLEGVPRPPLPSPPSPRISSQLHAVGASVSARRNPIQAPGPPPPPPLQLRFQTQCDAERLSRGWQEGGDPGEWAEIAGGSI